MSRHQAPEELLLDYAAGALPEGPSLVVSLHVALDPVARRTVQDFQAVGGALLESETAASFEEFALERALAKLDSIPVEARPEPPQPIPGFEWAPTPLLPYLGRTPRWRKRFGGFESIPVRIPGDTHRVEILRLMPGRGLPQHHHTGYEYTTVMQGGFTDNTGNYGVGDFAMGPGSQDHEPIADLDDGVPCIAMIVLERPLVLTGPWGRWFNPLVKRGWL
jgi:putative transcriptional regulator